MSRAYYNEIDPEAVEVLKELVASGVIAPGDVDGRSIKEVTPDDIRGYTQCHFFAGVGLWSVGARLAGFPDERPVWSASCPCQGESLAGKRLGADDPRHLWPDLHRLIRAARPPIIVGEQVAAAAGTHWLDGICADLALENYSARAVDIPACSIDAPHQRNRLYWIAMADTQEQHGGAGLCEGGAIRHGAVFANRDGGDLVLANTEGFSSGGDQPQRRSEGRAVDGRPDASSDVVHTASERRGQGWPEPVILGGRSATAVADVCELGSLGDAIGAGLEGQRRDVHNGTGWSESYRSAAQANGRNGSWWSDGEWIHCHDNKARRAKPGTPMLVDGMVGRSAVWRLAGNGILPQLAEAVFASILDVEAGVMGHAPIPQKDETP